MKKTAFDLNLIFEKLHLISIYLEKLIQFQFSLKVTVFISKRGKFTEKVFKGPADIRKPTRDCREV